MPADHHVDRVSTSAASWSTRSVGVSLTAFAADLSDSETARSPTTPDAAALACSAGRCQT